MIKYILVLLYLILWGIAVYLLEVSLKSDINLFVRVLIYLLSLGIVNYLLGVTCRMMARWYRNKRSRRH